MPEGGDVLPAKAYYLAVDLGCLAVPLLCTFHPKIRFDRAWGAFLPALVTTAAVFLAWDAWFTQRGIWGFHPRYLLGGHIGNLPVEEALFFLCIPYACVFTYFCVDKFHPTWTGEHPADIRAALALALLLVLCAAGSLHRSYTLLATGLTGLLLFWLSWRRWRFFRVFFVSFTICLAPFLVADAFLTGTGLSQPIVWYNDTQNSGIRFLTIPLEDFAYGLLLILTNVVLFEERRKPR